LPFLFFAVNYRDVLYRDYSTHFSQPTSIGDDVNFPMFAEIYQSLPSRDARILDLGCGRGSWLRWMRNKGFQSLTGVDFSRVDLDNVGLADAVLQQGDLFAFLRSGTERFDVVHAKDVIEHMTKDEVVEFLTLCRARLVPGGQLWISTFNALAPMAAQTWRGDFTHETSFTPQSMRQVMHACGFPEVEVTCCHPVPRSLPGRLRKLMMIPVSAMCRFVAILRYGGGVNLDCRPTLLAMARTKAGSAATA
jgi:predicted TPR repeat methyltransferase